MSLRNFKSVPAILALLLVFSCTSEKNNISAENKDRNILWFDATANFQRFSFKDSITYYLELSKNAGVTDVVVDVKPISGEVLYKSSIAPQMTE